jgi:Beta propeller domain
MLWCLSKRHHSYTHACLTISLFPISYCHSFTRVVYAAYGDYIIIWDALTGKRIVDFQLPATEEKSDSEATASSGTSGKMAPPMYDMYYPYIPKPSISSLMLLDDRLVVLATNYGYPLVAKLGYTPVLNEYRNTRVMIFDTSSLSKSKNATLTLLGYDDINGYLNSMRAVGNNLHIATTISVNTYPYFYQPFDRYMYPELTDAEYAKKIAALAEGGILANFTNKLTDELKVQGKLPNIARLNVMQTQWNNTMATSLTYYPNGLFGSIAQITSLDMTEDMSKSGRPTLKASGSFLPYYAGTMYASDDTIVIAASGYDYKPRAVGNGEFTYLLAFSLDGASSEPNSVGQVPGSLMNSYSMDVVDDVLRIGTTERTGWDWGWMPMPIDTAAAEDTSSTEDANATTSEPVPTNTWAPKPPPKNESDIPINTVPPRTESLTANYITTLRLPGQSNGDAGEMKKLGELKLGKMDESFTSMRFFDNVAYAITFLQKDPLYALDLSNPSKPRILDELGNITGFSSYLHSMNDDNTLLLGIGDETDENGMTLGLMISVFDASKPANIKLKTRYVVERDPDTWSSSDATYDFHAIRYEPTTQQLIIPMSINNWEKPEQSFNGFSVFSVTADKIKEKCRIEHGNYYGSGNYCYYCAFLPSRSFIFSGDVMTVNSQFVRMTNPDTCSPLWDFEVKITDESGSCCGYLY